MDGRHIPWRTIGAVLIAAAGCRHNSKYPDNVLPQSGQPSELTTPGSSGGLFGKSTTAPMAYKPVEIVEHKKGPLSADFFTSMAEANLQIALGDKPPQNRDQYIDRARTLYERALKQEPKNQKALLGVARMYTRLGEKDRAVEAYAKCVKYHPKDPEIHHEVAKMHAVWQDWNAAIASCNDALKFEPDNRVYRKTLGFCLARAGRWEEGFAVLCQVMPEAQARHNLAGLLDQMGQAQACRQQLMLALQADPNYAPSREFLMELNGQSNPVQQAGYNEQQ